MGRMLINLGLTLAANAIGLIVAAALLDDMSLGVNGFIIAVLLFTGAMVLMQPLFTKLALKYMSSLRGSTTLVSTLVALIITAVVSDSLQISGFVTWVAATVIVWAACLLGGVLLPWLVVRRAAKRAGLVPPRREIKTWG